MQLDEADGDKTLADVIWSAMINEGDNYNDNKIGLIHSHQVSHDLKEIAIGSSKKELKVFSSPQKVSPRCRLQSCGSNFLFFLCVMRG